MNNPHFWLYAFWYFNSCISFAYTEQGRIGNWSRGPVASNFSLISPWTKSRFTLFSLCSGNFTVIWPRQLELFFLRRTYLWFLCWLDGVTEIQFCRKRDKTRQRFSGRHPISTCTASPLISSVHDFRQNAGTTGWINVCFFKEIERGFRRGGILYVLH